MEKKRGEVNYIMSYHPTYDYAVFLDGKPIKNCLTFDEEQGYVKYYELDVNGNIQMDGSKVKIMIARGKVEKRSMMELIEKMR
jgi:hypothetical protein